MQVQPRGIERSSAGTDLAMHMLQYWPALLTACRAQCARPGAGAAAGRG